MEDGEKQKNVEENLSGQSFTNIFNAGIVFQSIWVRCRSVFPVVTDRKFMESELRFVLYSGVIFWAIYLLYEAVK